MFQWESYVSLGVLLGLLLVLLLLHNRIVPRSVFTKSSSIKLYKEDKRLLFNSDPWPPAEQKLEMPCDTYEMAVLVLPDVSPLVRYRSPVPHEAL